MKKTLLSLLSVFAIPVLLPAQVATDHAALTRSGKRLDVAFELHTAYCLKNRYKMILTPYVWNNADTVWLPKVEVYGKIRYKRERQEQALDGNPTWRLSSGQIMEGETYAYAASVPYEKWMRTASLGVKRRTVGCACDCYDGEQTLLAAVPLYVPPTPVTENILPVPAKFEVVDARKRWAFDGEEMRVFYPVSSTTLYAERYDNRATLDKIIAGIRRIGETDSLRLNGVEITGFASPEGALALNTRLARERAEALRDYIARVMPELGAEDFELINGVENWGRLREMVAASDMEYRDEVLQAIDQTQGDARKTALKRIAGGKAYRHILDNFYPELRNACYIAVYYDVLNDVAADAVNASNALIRDARYAEALEILKPYEKDERAWNSIGTCHMMLDREEEAVGWFRKAADAGSEAAVRNLEQIE